jgi:ribonuclease-3
MATISRMGYNPHMQSLENLLKLTQEIEAKLGYSFKDKNFLILSFIHRSYINENRQTVQNHNERLEFLGDSVLGLLIAEYLYKYLPSTPEGELSHLRSRLVEAGSCVTYVSKLDLESYILMGKGERRSYSRGRESILADLFEAIIGAIYLDGGLDAARKFLFKNFSKEIDAILKKPDRNWKALLQELVQKLHKVSPVYHVIESSGPDHNKTFIISVSIHGEEVGRGQGASKKEAQQAAAEQAINVLKKRTS